MDEYNDYTTVASLLGGDIILVGEKHGNRDSASLMDTVLETVEPQTVAAEMPPRSRVPSTGGMGRARKYATENSAPLIRIDKSGRFNNIRDTDISMSELIRKANLFSYEIETDGDLNEDAIWDARNRIKTYYGNKVWKAMYPEREAAMAKHLLKARSEFETPIVAGIGAFHLPAVSQMIQHESPAEKLTDSRIVV